MAQSPRIATTSGAGQHGIDKRRRRRHNSKIRARQAFIVAIVALIAAIGQAQDARAAAVDILDGIDTGASIAGQGHAGAPVGVTYEDAVSGSGGRLSDAQAVSGVEVGADSPASSPLSVAPEKLQSTSSKEPAAASTSPSTVLPVTVPSDGVIYEKVSPAVGAATPTANAGSTSQAPPSAQMEMPLDPPGDGSDGTSPPSELPDLPTDRNCRLLGPFALFVQAIMGVAVVGSLVFKRQHERPMRPWKIWTLDISKQMLGQLFVHILNVLLSSLGSMESVGGNNPCSLYFINIAIDTTVGVLFIYYCMRFLTHYFTDVLGWPGFVSGQYTSTPSVIGRRRRDGPRRMPVSPSAPSSPHVDMDTGAPLSPGMGVGASTNKPGRPRLSFFFKQLALYLLSLFLMKVMVLLLFAVFPVLFRIGRWVLDLFGNDRRAQVFFVMAIFPLLMNTVQFWLIDSVLRHNPNTSRYLSDEDAQLTGEAPYSHQRDIESGGLHPDSAADGYTASKSWWAQTFGLGQDASSHRGAYQEVSTQGPPYHEEGTLSGSEDDESSQHTYPPVSSTSSSVAGLDAAHAQRSSGGRAMTPSHSMTGSSKSQAKGASPPLQESTDIKTGHEDDEADEAWDAWGDDDEDEGPSSASTAVATRTSSRNELSAGKDHTHDARKKLD